MATVPIWRTARRDIETPAYTNEQIILRQPPPKELGLIIGDAIHNYRVSLDLLANDLVAIENKEVNGVYFPFAERAEDLDMMIQRRKFDRAAPESVSLLRSLRPYAGGNEQLRSLHDLDIRDKHQMIIPVIGHIRTPTGGLGFYGSNLKPGVIGQSKYLASAYGGDALLLGEQLPVVFSLEFPPFSPFDGRKIVPALYEAGEYLFGVFQAFAALYGRTLTQ